MHTRVCVRADYVAEMWRNIYSPCKEDLPVVQSSHLKYFVHSKQKATSQKMLDNSTALGQSVEAETEAN